VPRLQHHSSVGRGNPRRNSGTEWFIMIHPLGQRWVKIQPYSTPLRTTGSEKLR
jgi:hypothetical protein